VREFIESKLAEQGYESTTVTDDIVLEALKQHAVHESQQLLERKGHSEVIRS
jgi:hypothetical protein